MSDNFRDRGPFCVALKGIPQHFSESDVLWAVKEFEPLHAKALTDSRWIVSLKTKKDAEDAHHTAQLQYHEFTFFISVCEKSEIPDEWIQTEKENDTVGDSYSGQATTFQGDGQMFDFRTGIPSAQTSASSMSFTTGMRRGQQCDYHPNQVNMHQNSFNQAMQQQFERFPQPEMIPQGIPMRSPQRNKEDDTVGDLYSGQATTFQEDGQMFDFRTGMPSAETSASSMPFTTGMPPGQQYDNHPNQVNMHQNSFNQAVQQQFERFLQPEMIPQGIPMRSPQRNKEDYTAGDSYGDVATSVQAADPVFGFRRDISSVQTSSSSASFSTGMPPRQQVAFHSNQMNIQQSSFNPAMQENFVGFPQPAMDHKGMNMTTPQNNLRQQFQLSAHQGFQQNTSSYIHPVTEHQLGQSLQQFPQQSGQFYSQYSKQLRDESPYQQCGSNWLSCDKASFMDQPQKPNAPLSRTIKVSGLPQGIRRDVLETFFEGVSDGGEIKDLIFHPDSSTSIIKFKDPSVTERVLQKHPLAIKGKQLKVEVHTGDDKYGKEDDSTDEKDEKPKMTAPLSRTIKVSGLPQGIRRDVLETFFEGVSDGGEIKDLIFHPDSSTAIIKFKDPSVTERVLQKHPLAIKGKQLKVEVHTGDDKYGKEDASTDEKDEKPKMTAPLSRKIKVSGLPQGIRRDVLETFFEGVSDGGEIKDLIFHPDSSTAVIKFKDPSVTERVLQKHPLAIKGKQLKVEVHTGDDKYGKVDASTDEKDEKPKMTAPLSRTIKVSGLPQGIRRDVLETFFEGVSDGGEIKDLIFHPDSSTAVIKFKDPSVTERVLQKHPLAIKGKQLKVEVHTGDDKYGKEDDSTDEKDEKPKMTAPLSRKIKVSGLPQGIRRDVLETFFEGASDGGEIKDLIFHPDSSTAVIKFKDPSVTERVLQKHPLAIKGKQLKVEVHTGDDKYGKVDASTDEKDEKPKMTAPLSRTIKVSGLPQGIRCDVLETFFEGVSDGGEIKDLIFHPDSSTSIIKFKDPSVTERVLQKHPLAIKGKQLKVEVHTGDDKYGKEDASTDEKDEKPKMTAPLSRTIKVSGLPQGIRCDVLETFFEGVSDGGEIKDLIFHPDSSTAIIKFKDPSVTERVLQKHPLAIKGKQLKVEVHTGDDKYGKEDASTDEKDEKPKMTAPLSRKIKVSGLPQGIRRDVLETFFEGVSDGGEIKDLIFHPDSSTAVIKFKDPSVTERVLQKHPLAIKGKQLKVEVHTGDDKYGKEDASTDEKDEKPKMTAPLSRTIKVSGLPQGIRRDVLETFFEGVSDGGEIKDLIFHPDSSTAIIKFKDPSVTERVLQKHPLAIKGKQLKVEVHTGDDKYGKEDASTDEKGEKPKMTASLSRTIKVSGLQQGIRRDVLETFFEGVSDGGEIKDLIFHPDSSTAIIKFKDPSVTERVLQKHPLAIKGKQLKVEVHTGDDKYGKEDDSTDEKDEKPKMTAPLSRTIKVSGLPQGIRRDVLETFFEGVSDGGEIKDLIFHPDSSTAIIKFKDPSVTERVLQKHPLAIKGKQLKVEVHTGDDKYGKEDDSTDEKDEKPKMTVEVTGFSKDVTKEILEMYFRNEKRSGGGPISKMELKEEACLITFETVAATSAVLERSHKLNEMEMVVKLYIPPKPVAMYEDRFLIKGLNEKITKEYLTLFLEEGCGVSPKEILYVEEDEQKALVIFERSPDLKRLIEYCQVKKVQGAQLKVSQVPISRCILVTNLTPNTSQDMMMQMCFVLGGKKVEKVEKMDEGTNLIYFEDHAAIDFVIGQHHKLDNSQLQVQLFYPSIGRITSAENNRKFENPEPFVYKVNLYIIPFFKQIPTVKAWLEQEMLTVHGRLIVPSDNSDTLEVLSMLTSEMEGVKRLVKTWKETVEQKLEECIKQVNCNEFQIVPEIWGSTLVALEKMVIPDEKAVIICTDQKQCVIRVTGFKNMVDHVSSNLKRVIDVEEKELELKKQRIRDIRHLSKQEIYFLSAVNFPSNVHKKWSDVKCTVEEEDMISFEGTITDIKQAELLMDETLKSIKKASLSKYPRNQLQLLSMKETGDYVRQKLEEKDCLGIWEIDDECLIVYDRSDEKVNDSIQIIRNSLVKKSLQFTPEQQSVLNSDVWTLKLAEVRRQYQGYLAINHDAQNATIEITVTDQYAGEIIDIVNDFLQANVQVDETISINPCKVRHMKQWREFDINNICKSLQKDMVTIHFRTDAVVIQGTWYGVKKAKIMVSDLLEGILYKKKMIDIPGIYRYMCSEKGGALIKKIEEENKCTIDIIDEEDNTNQTLVAESRLELKKHMKRPEEHLSCRMPGGQNIFVFHGDITDLDIDILVIACNEVLDHSAGLAKIVVKKGGDVIQKECSQYTNHPLMEGDVVFISGGKLKCKIVAYAVSAIWQGGTENDESLLNKVIIKSLEETAYKKFTSIGIPAVWTEMFDYPVSETAQIIVRTVKDYFELKKFSSVKNVYLCDLNIQHVKASIEAVKVFFPQSALSIYQDLHQAAADASVGTRSARFGIPSGSSPPRIQVVKGELVHQKAEVLVNTTSSNLDLNKGAVSASLLKAGGQELQKECTKKYPNGIKPGDVAITGPGDLVCGYIFHGTLPNWNKDGSLLEIMRTFIYNCLNEADRLNKTSAAFPALGTGTLHYPRNVVAREMFNCISNFLTKNPDTSLDAVYLVVYEKDLRTLEAFEKEQEEFKKRSCTSPTRHVGNADSKKKIWHGGRNKYSDDASMLSKNQQSPEYIPEVRVKQGDITKYNVDAIVNPSNAELALGGAVSQAILKKTGMELEEEFNKLRREGAMQINGLVITRGYQLPCKWIMHVNVQDRPKGWKGVFMKCIEKAVQMQLRSIAFPALGTGPLENASPEEIGKALYNATCEAGSNTLKDVQMVVFEQQMVSKIEAGVITAKKSTDKSPSLWQNFKGSSSAEPSDHVQPVDEKKLIIAACADSETDIEISLDHLESKYKTEVKREHIIEDPIKNMSKDQISAMERLGKKYSVRISTDTHMGRIRLEGLQDDVTNVKSAVYKQLMEFGKMDYKEKEAEMLFHLVQWFWIEITPDEEKFIAYNKDLNAKIEEAYNHKEKHLKILHDNETYIIDFNTLKKYPVNSASDPDARKTVLRKDKLKDTVSACIPDHWDPMAKENLRKCSLSSASGEYADVTSLFMATINIEKKDAKFTIEKIERIQNKILYAQYHNRKKHMEEKNSGIENEMRLWHGTGGGAIDSINEHGFNRSFCGTENAKKFGDGVYFAKDSYYSARDVYSKPDGNGNKKMYLTKVLTGRYTKGEEDLRVPPLVTEGQIDRYDSVVNNMTNPGIFVIFHDTQAYPEYLITFKCN